MSEERKRESLTDETDMTGSSISETCGIAAILAFFWFVLPLRQRRSRRARRPVHSEPR